MQGDEQKGRVEVSGNVEADEVKRMDGLAQLLPDSNGKKKAAATQGEEPIRQVDLEPGRSWLLYNVLSKEECDEFIRLTEQKGYDDTSTFAYMYRDRDNDRLMLDNTELAAKIWERIKDYVPNIGPFKKKGLNERWRFCRYREGQYFGKHCDGVFARNESEASMLTMMVYLNTSGEDFEGGETVFYGWTRGRSMNSSEVTHTIKPVAGMCLIFYQNTMLHEGMPITKGLKYIMRSDVMYEVHHGWQKYL